ncbi:MAG: DEAD/DEAH box helicase [Ilumatobacteraceae bacterium]
MRFDLLDYQRAAAIDCLDRLNRGRMDWANHGARSSFALSAVTGAGKTVIASAVIEAMIHGSADLGVDPDPRAAFLWVTDDPALNRQTRMKMLASSDLLQPARLAVLDNDFLDSTLAPNRVYFLNIQKLSKSAGLAHGGHNLRAHSMWEILGNTINGANVDLYLVLDEAHRGMKAVSDRKSIVQRIISGQGGSNPPAPVVWGISATIARFAAAMDDQSHTRTTYPPVEVDINGVRASGLVKDEIVLDEPNESGTFSGTLLREAVRTTLDFERRWADYSASQDEPEVRPVLVVQVTDKASHASLSATVGTIESEWPDLGPDAVAHVFGDHVRLNLATRAVDWVPPESIQGDTEIRVVLAKQAISTGWDCPRAEVLYSERPAKDVTHIAQIIGRMVRQPLTHRIATDDFLNTVACYLPLFNRDALGSIKSELEGTGKGNGDHRVGSTVVRRGAIFERNKTVAADVFQGIITLPSVPAPDAYADPLRRAKELARLLTDTARGEALLPEAGALLTKALMFKLDGMAAQYAEQVDRNVIDLEHVDVRRSRLSILNNELGTETRSIATHASDLMHDAGKIINRIKEGVGKDYLAHRAARRTTDQDLLDVRVQVAALFMIDEVRSEIGEEATKWVRTQLARFHAEIANTTGATRDAFRRIQEQTTEPEPVTVDLRDNAVAATVDGDGEELHTYPGHIYSDESGAYPLRLNDWEEVVVRKELGRRSFAGWYRNPSRPSPSALRIAYRSDNGMWTSVQPDFVFASRRDDGTVGLSIVDPHGDHLADALPKLRALAGYAEQFGERFIRIESISKVGDQLVVLDLLDPKVRTAVRAFTGAEVQVLYQSSPARAYA